MVPSGVTCFWLHNADGVTDTHTHRTDELEEATAASSWHCHGCGGQKLKLWEYKECLAPQPIFYIPKVLASQGIQSSLLEYYLDMRQCQSW